MTFNDTGATGRSRGETSGNGGLSPEAGAGVPREPGLDARSLADLAAQDALELSRTPDAATMPLTADGGDGWSRTEASGPVPRPSTVAPGALEAVKDQGSSPEIQSPVTPRLFGQTMVRGAAMGQPETADDSKSGSGSGEEVLRTGTFTPDQGPTDVLPVSEDTGTGDRGTTNRLLGSDLTPRGATSPVPADRLTDSGGSDTTDRLLKVGVAVSRYGRDDVAGPDTGNDTDPPSHGDGHSAGHRTSNVSERNGGNEPDHHPEQVPTGNVLPTLETETRTDQEPASGSGDTGRSDGGRGNSGGSSGGDGGNDSGHGLPPGGGDEEGGDGEQHARSNSEGDMGLPAIIRGVRPSRGNALDAAKRLDEWRETHRLDGRPLRSPVSRRETRPTQAPAPKPSEDPQSESSAAAKTDEPLASQATEPAEGQSSAARDQNQPDTTEQPLREVKPRTRVDPATGRIISFGPQRAGSEAVFAVAQAASVKRPDLQKLAASDYHESHIELLRFLKMPETGELNERAAILLERCLSLMSVRAQRWLRKTPQEYQTESRLAGSSRDPALNTMKQMIRVTNAELLMLASVLDRPSVNYRQLEQIYPLSRSPLTLAARLGIDITTDTSLETLRAESIQKLRGYVNAKVITEQGFEVLQHRYGLDNDLPMTQGETAKILSMKPIAVSDLEIQTMQNLDNATAAER